MSKIPQGEWTAIAARYAQASRSAELRKATAAPLRRSTTFSSVVNSGVYIAVRSLWPAIWKK